VIPIGNASLLAILRIVALYASAALLAKVFVAILLEYRWYFPPNFEASSFLVGRRELFEGVYEAAFYTHLIAGPAAMLLGTLLMLSGERRLLGRGHAWLGRLHVTILTALLAPSGLVMAYWAHAGAIAGWGFGLLAIATAATGILAAQRARRRRFQSHRRWATRCFILLCSPLLLRVAVGLAGVLGMESEAFYRLNAWLSWLIPLAVYEVAQVRSITARGQASRSVGNLPPVSQGFVDGY
jgi:hypothetical protein